MLRVIYPAVRLVPTEDGPQLRLEWVIRAAHHQPDGWMTMVAKVSPAAAIPVAVKLLRASTNAKKAAELFDHLAAVPGVRLTKATLTEEDR